MQIREIMTSNPACCTPDSTLPEIARMMREHDCGCIPVVNSLADMKPVGTVTDRDITIRSLANNQNPMTMKASDIMTPDIATLTPETSLEECFDVMEDREIRRVVVVDEQGRCSGIVAQADVVQSGVNPIRANRVIREISESSPSRARTGSGGGQSYRSYFSGRSLMSAGGGSLLPLLIGLGSGAAVMYLINARQSSPRRVSVGAINPPYESDFLNAGNEENFGKYVDAEQEIEKRQTGLKNRVESARTDNNLPSKTTTAAGTFDEEDETVVNIEKGRSARHGKA